MGNNDSPSTGAERHRSAVDQATISQGALERAERAVQRALGRAQPGRERAWARDVQAELEAAEGVLDNHKQQVAGPGGLYDELRFEAPWLLPRLDRLVDEIDAILLAFWNLRVQLERIVGGDQQALPPVRMDAADLVMRVRAVIAAEADLIYERFREPPALD